MHCYKFTILALVLIGAALGLTAGLCHAQDGIDVPRLSMQRVSASLGADVEWIPAKLAPLKDKQFVPVLAAAYKLGEHLAAVGSVRVGFVDRQFRYTVGARYTFLLGGHWVTP
jgi:hypothetical protein